jgi:hypothetical protein
MEGRRRKLTVLSAGAAIACLALVPGWAGSQEPPAGPIEISGKSEELLGISAQTYRELLSMYAKPASIMETTGGRNAPLAVPDIYGHGSVLTVGKIMQKVTNFGYNGNVFPSVSSDPSGQWPGQSGVEYLYGFTIAVGGVNPAISPGDPVQRRRVSSGIEWRPPTLQPEDRIYPSYEGAINGERYSNDDGDTYLDQDGDRKPLIDEDFLDGRDNDGDGKVDEDYGALGQQMYSLVMRDDTQEAIQFAQAEPHVPVGLEIRERAWAYSIARYENFNVYEYEIFNRSGHEIDSLCVAFPTDMDCGPVDKSNYYADDLDGPRFPSGSFTYVLPDKDYRLQDAHDPNDVGGIDRGVALCDHLNIRTNGFSIADDDGDEGKTTGVPSMLLISHTIDPTGKNGPWRVGWRALRSYTGGTPYTQGGPPRIDQQRFEFMTSVENVSQDKDDPWWGFVNVEPGDQKGDYAAWASIGPWFHFAPNASITVTIAFAVQRGNLIDMIQYPARYEAFKRDSAAHPAQALSNQDRLFAQYPALKNAFDAQVAYEGIWEKRSGFPVTDSYGRETGIRLPRGSLPTPGDQDCHDQLTGNSRTLSPDYYTWFDFDCDYCTGIYRPADATDPGGQFHKFWNASAPPPSPGTNAGASYNYTDNPSRLVAAAGDNQVTLAWDNLSETTPDPGGASPPTDPGHVFDFRGYKIWKVSNWTRPVGTPGPADEQWALLGEYRLFDYSDFNGPIPNNAYAKKLAPVGGPPGDTLIFPKVWIPLRRDSMEIRLYRGDFWDKQSGNILKADLSIPCIKDTLGNCLADSGCALGAYPCLRVGKIRYPVGRYKYVDREVQNGFMYFYSITAFDSTRDGITEGRRSAVEAEGVVPQTTTKLGKQVWVVPNPYKGFQRLSDRPSSWDLTPNATDPTGTHLDFYGLPPGRWTIRIYTVSGDLVQELHWYDPVNQSVRTPVTVSGGAVKSGATWQQDTPNDGQARWNLISRNGQDVVSGIYLFTVESSQGIQRGKFVVVR